MAPSGRGEDCSWQRKEMLESSCVDLEVAIEAVHACLTGVTSSPHTCEAARVAGEASNTHAAQEFDEGVFLQSLDTGNA